LGGHPVAFFFEIFFFHTNLLFAKPSGF